MNIDEIHDYLVQNISYDTTLSKDNIELHDFSFLYNDEYLDICTYSGNFINDSGNVMLYKEFEKIIGEILLEKLLGGF